MTKYKKPFSEEIVQKIMKNILSIVKYFHDKGIIHHDLKLDNILVKYQNEYDLQTLNIYNAEIKIIDFNNSYLPNLNGPMTFVGTVPNMAPTIVKNLILPRKKYDEKVDIWSLGVICYEMLFGSPLFPSMNDDKVFADILAGNFSIPKTISIQARTFLYCMLRKQGINRLTVTELLNHEFIVGDYHKFKHYDINQNNNVIRINSIPNNDKILFNNKNANNNNKIIYNNAKANKNLNLIVENSNQINNDIIMHCATGPNMENKLQKMGMPDIVPLHMFSKNCIGCGENIMGTIYKCSFCRGLYVCEKCYLKYYKNHVHVFVKFEPKKVQHNNQLLNNNNNNSNKTKFYFTNEKGSTVKMIAKSNYPINELINLYLKTIKRFDLINNYDSAFQFIYNSQILNYFKDTTVGNLFSNHREYMQVKEIKLNNI
jgi:serine/threonine protein kinase